MAAMTRGKTKSRMDFSGAISEVYETNASAEAAEESRPVPEPEPVVQEKKTAPSVTPELTGLLKKKPAGRAKSVYIEADVYEYVQGIADTNGVNFSTVLNVLIKQIMGKQ